MTARVSAFGSKGQAGTPGRWNAPSLKLRGGSANDAAVFSFDLHFKYPKHPSQSMSLCKLLTRKMFKMATTPSKPSFCSKKRPSTPSKPLLRKQKLTSTASKAHFFCKNLPATRADGNFFLFGGLRRGRTSILLPQNPLRRGRSPIFILLECLRRSKPCFGYAKTTFDGVEGPRTRKKEGFDRVEGGLKT